MGNETTTETAAAAASTLGPSSSKLKKAIRGVLEEATYSPNLTMGQIRAKVKERIGHKYPGFDFEAPAWRQESKTLVAALVKEHEMLRSAAPVSSSSDSKKRQQEGQGQEGEEEDEQERRRRKEERKKAKLAAAAATPTTSSSAASVSSASASTTTGGTGTTGGEDPVYKRLVKLAQAMRLVPAILAGLKEMAPAARVEELRARLKAKGAVFDVVPSMESIKKAEAESALKKDLEGIDAANIVEGGRRRVAAVVAAAATKAAATDAASPASAAKWEKVSSQSDDELDL